MRPGKKTRPRGGDNSYWTSYSDMMAGMLFVFALILFAAVYQLVDLQQKKTIELQTKEAQLSTQQSLLIDQEAELKDKEELLAATTLALQQQQEELDQNRTALTSAQDSLALQQSKIEEQAALLAEKDAALRGAEDLRRVQADMAADRAGRDQLAARFRADNQQAASDIAAHQTRIDELTQQAETLREKLEKQS